VDFIAVEVKDLKISHFLEKLLTLKHSYYRLNKQAPIEAEYEA
jgi:hypothetical protein